MKQNKKSGFALIAGIGIIALIAIVGFLVIKSNVIDPAKNAAAVLKSATTKTSNSDTYGPNCPDCTKLELALKVWKERLTKAEEQYMYYSDEVVDGRGSGKVDEELTDYSTDLGYGPIPLMPNPRPRTNLSQAKAAKKVRDDTKKTVNIAQKELDNCIERKKIYCDGYNDGKDTNKTTGAYKAKAAEEANAARQRALVK